MSRFNVRHGIERECLRIAPNGNLSQAPHPEAFGSKLTHNWITTDFSEAQLELITPPFGSEKGALTFLQKLHRHLFDGMGDELIWPSSTPCALDKIPIADYGSSNRGLEKSLYRNGLVQRYGADMQLLSGIHYNFSLAPSFWESWHTDRTNGYLALLRNFLRHGWLNTYLFGATPCVDASYLPAEQTLLEKLSDDTLYLPYATALRMSEIGYYSRIQQQVPISFNALNEYLHDMEKAVTQPCPTYGKIDPKKQINSNLLQIEAEHYSRMRPKPDPRIKKRPIEALAEGGIHYVEARAVDIDPFEPDGITLDQLYFLHTFCLFCLTEKSPPIDPEGAQQIANFQNQVALHGRDPGLGVADLGKALLRKMRSVAQELGPRYVAALERQKKKIDHPDKLPSAKVLAAIEKEGSHQRWGLKLAKAHKEKICARNFNGAFHKKLEAERVRSLEGQTLEEIRDDFTLRGHEDLELSTQVIIREALKRDVRVEVLDRKDNFLRLSKGDVVEYVKQASMTSLDPLNSYFIMENKRVTKRILDEHGLRTPEGWAVSSVEEGLASYTGGKVVVKPNHGNYGDGISFVEGEIEEALHEAFKFGDEVLIEEFVPGQEHRVLVIQGEVIAVCQRHPANVVGDGVHTVAELARMKNRNPRMYKKYPIRLGRVEKEQLEKQGLDSGSVIEEGKRVYLRRNHNVSTGGDSWDMEIDESYKRVAVQAAEAVGAKICGVDMMIEKPEVEGAYAIIELNFNPALYLHRYPVQGEQRFVERAILDAIGLL